MDIRKADSKGRLTGFAPDGHYVINSREETLGGYVGITYRVKPVPPIPEAVDESAYDSEELTRLKEAALEALYDAGLDEEAYDFLEIADRVGEAMGKIIQVVN